MSIDNPNAPSAIYATDPTLTPLHYAGGVSWGAVFAGATVAAALTLILLLIGAGLGLSAVSPWSGEGVGAATLGLSTIAWITFMSLAASGVGGYVAGRLRRKWVGIRSDEVYFRDTAHGLLAWAIATLAMATLLTSVAGAIIGGSARAGAEIAGDVAASVSVAAGSTADVDTDTSSNPLDYFIDVLFRANPTTSAPSMAARRDPAAVNAEVARIFVRALAADEPLPQDDLDYVARLVAERTDLTPQQAERRVRDIYEQARTRIEELEVATKEAADAATKASAYASLWFSIALLAGAFLASFAATCGGRQRDFES